ncbi:MAG TPA: hypothetical protein VD972_19330, partial [Hyalangium sp.]|nr:hypothetical protein [Hyalangium sp.]
MASSRDSLKAALLQRLLEASADLPTSTLGRLGRTAGAALRSGRLLLGARKQGAAGEAPLDLEAVAKVVSSLGELKGIAMKMGQIL